LDQQYKVKKTIGVRMGMYGLMQKDDKYWKTLTAEDVSDIQTKGGSILGVD
jgi:6-phosphofructokinase